MIDKASYEKVSVTQTLNALIAYLDEDLLSKSELVMKQNYIPAHWHRSIEFSLVCKGEVELWINNHKEIIKEGEFIFVNSGQIHKLARASDKTVEVLLVIIPYEFLKKVLPEVESYHFNIHKDIPQKQRLMQIYTQFLAYAKAPEEYDEFMMNAYVNEVLFILLKYFQVDIQNEKEHGFVKKQQHKVLDYIEDNYKEDLCLANLAKVCHMSEEHFSRSFHENFGMNFKTYLTNYRLYCSYSEVVESAKSMQDIALDNGFSSVKSFINAFKEGYGSTPFQFRKQYAISKKGNYSVK